MSARLIVIALQVALSWLIAPLAERYLSFPGDAQTFIRGAIVAAIVWLVGWLAAHVLRQAPRPGLATFASSLAGALLAAGLIVFQVIPRLLGLPLAAPPLAVLLAFALVGYHVRR